MNNSQIISTFNSAVSPFVLEPKEEPFNRHYLDESREYLDELLESFEELLEKRLFGEVFAILCYGSLVEERYQWEVAKQLMRQIADKAVDKDFLNEIMHQYEFPELILNILWVLLLTSPKRTPTMKNNASFIRDYISINMVGISYMEELECSYFIKLLISASHDVEETPLLECDLLTARERGAEEPKKQLTEEKKKGRERKKSILFSDKEVKQQECERVKGYLRECNSQVAKWRRDKTNPIQKVAICFVRHWKEHGYIDEDYSPRALAKFFVEDCGVQMAEPGKDIGKTYDNLGQGVKEKEADFDEEIYALVGGKFKK